MRILTVVLVVCLLLLFGGSCHSAQEISPTSTDTNMADDMVKLPSPRRESSTSLEEAIVQRRSRRSFTQQDLSWEQVSQLLWAAQGITDESTQFRAAPSAGALYPLELYVVTGEGVYHYLPQGHELEKVLDGDFCPPLCEAALSQPAVEDAPVSIVIAAVYQRTEKKYGERAVRYVHLEAGHAAQNLCLEATAGELGTVTVGAFNDDLVAKLLDLPENEAPLYLITVGKK